MNVGTGANKLMDKAHKAEIHYVDPTQYSFSAEFPLEVQRIVMKTSSHDFVATNPLGDRLFDLCCQWTTNCVVQSRKKTKTKNAMSKQKQLNSFFRTFPAQLCTFVSEKTTLFSPPHDTDAVANYVVTARMRVQQGYASHTLGDVIRNNQRISEKNILKWACQMLEMMLSYHNHNVVLRQFTIDDIVVASDKSVFLLYNQGTTKKSRNRSRRSGASTPASSRPSTYGGTRPPTVPTVAEIEAAEKQAEEQTLKTTRDLWYHPGGWFKAAEIIGDEYKRKCQEPEEGDLPEETLSVSNVSSASDSDMLSFSASEENIGSIDDNIVDMSLNDITSMDNTIENTVDIEEEKPQKPVIRKPPPQFRTPKAYPMLSLCEQNKGNIRIIM